MHTWLYIFEDIYHHIIGFDACHNALKALALLSHCQVVVDAANEVLHAVYHHVHHFDVLHISHVLLDGRQQEAVLGQPLHGTDNDVGQPQAVAHLLRLTPGQVDSEQRVVLIELLAVKLAGALLRTVNLEINTRLDHLREKIAVIVAPTL